MNIAYYDLERARSYTTLIGSERLQTNFSEGGAFLLIEQWRPLDDDTPSFFSNSKSPILGL